MSHAFLLKGEEPPVCITCDELLTVKHILLFCSDFIEIREKETFYISATVDFSPGHITGQYL